MTGTMIRTTQRSGIRAHKRRCWTNVLAALTMLSLLGASASARNRRPLKRSPGPYQVALNAAKARFGERARLVKRPALKTKDVVVYRVSEKTTGGARYVEDLGVAVNTRGHTRLRGFYDIVPTGFNASGTIRPRGISRVPTRGVLVEHRNETRQPLQLRFSPAKAVRSGVTDAYTMNPLYDPRSGRAATPTLVGQQNLKTVSKFLLDNPSPGTPLKLAIEGISTGKGYRDIGLRMIGPGRVVRKQALILDKTPAGKLKQIAGW